MPIYDRSSDLSQIAVNTHNIPDDSVDCGIRLLGWCRGPTCQKYARLRTFVIVLACAGILQGACETYFRVSAKQAAFENGYNPIIVEWLIVSSGIFQAVFALAVAYWAHKLHPISWLGGVIVIQGAVCVIAIIPSIANFGDGVRPSTQIQDSNVCTTAAFQLQKSFLSLEQSRTVTLIMLFLLQVALGLGSLVFYTIGITYIDDNSLSIDSPAVIATAYGAKMVGMQAGASLVLGVGATSVGWWLGWAILGPLVLVSGVLLGLFPKRLPKTVIHQAAQVIIEESRHRQFGSQFSTYIDDMNFGPSVKRLFGNKLLMFNLVGIMFVQAAMINYSLQEESYLQSRFFLPYSEEDGLIQEWNARFVSFFLRPPVMAVSMLIGGLVISKLKLSGRKIASINIGLMVKLMLTFVGLIFIKCDVGPIAGVTAGKLQQPYCSRQCLCSPTAFFPVCPENATVTYFSPCYAGCMVKSTINSVELYENCSCGSNYEMNSGVNIRATEGACTAETCSKMLIIFQVLTLSAAAMLGVSMIGKIIISLRSVLPQDKALALAMEVMFVGLFAYVPVHLAYDVVTRTTCTYWTPGYTKCLLRETPKHGNILNILTACLIGVGIIFDVLVFIYIKGLNIYNCKVTDLDYTPSLYSPIPREDPATSATPSATVATGGSPVTTLTTASPVQQRQSQPTRPAPKPEITVFRNPSSLTTSSAGENSIEANANGVTYAQVVFPPDKRKPTDGTVSPKRMAVRADVPLQHLSSQDVRAQLNNLKSFNPGAKPNAETTKTSTSSTPLVLHATDTPSMPSTSETSTSSTPLIVQTAVTPSAPLTVNTAAAKSTPVETDLDSIRPQSPETDF